MSLPARFRITLYLGVLLILRATITAQQEPSTADQVVSRYLEAVGANRFSTIKTFVETGELYGNVTNFWQASRSQWQSPPQSGIFESYFKSPNLRFNSSVTDRNEVIALHGCDGKTAWYIDSRLKRSEFKPKPESDGDCNEGFQGPVSRLHKPNTKMRLLKKKDVEGRIAWEIKVDIPKSSVTDAYYFDAETFLLLRFERLGMTVTYSDYRDLDGIKLPFRIVEKLASSKLITTVREVKIDVPIADARFSEPEINGGKIAASPVATAVRKGTELPANGSTPPPADAESSNVSRPDSGAANNAASIVELNFPNFTDCTIEELELTVPELKGLKRSADQERLAGLLEKIGVKTEDIARNTPNLISRETVVDSPEQARTTKREYDYLLLPHSDGTMVRLDEFRLDLKTGDKFQTDEAGMKESSFRDRLERASSETATSKDSRPPLTYGFATSWVHFYPSNRTRVAYRYLGEQKRDGHRTLVLAFAQKPALALLPAVFRYRDKTAPMFLQGIAWIDAGDFRILRLRTDLLSPVPEVSLQRLTADIQFGLTRVEQVASPLPLPREVMVTAVVGGSTVREIHQYSGYRLFRAQSRVVALP